MTAPTVTAILDANGIIGLAKADCFLLMPHLFTAVYVPSLVIAEVTDPISYSALQQALGSWLIEKVPSAQSLIRAVSVRHETYRHVLALAVDHQPSFLVTGDESLRRRAQALGVPSVDAPHLIQLFAEAKLIAAAKPHLDQMRQRGYGIPQDVYEQILRDLGEI